MRKIVSLVALAGIAAAPAAPALAQSDTQAEVRPQEGDALRQVEALRACQSQLDAQTRLACYDREAANFVAATDKGDLRVLDKAQVEKSRRGLFGFSLPRVDLFGGSKAGVPDEIEILESTITSVRQISEDSWQFRIAEGNALWQIAEAPMRFNAPRVGDAVEFKRASFGSYFIRVGKQIGVKGRRLG